MQSFDLPAERQLVLFVGRFANAKSPLDLVRAFSALPAADLASASLVLVGDGPLATDIRAALEARPDVDSHMLGWQEPREVHRLMAMATVMALPSVKEPWGAVVNEAMAAGTPVIASDRVGAAYDLIENGVNGWIVKSREAEALSSAISRALADTARTRQMGERARVAALAADAEYAAKNLLRAVEYAVS